MAFALTFLAAARYRVQLQILFDYAVQRTRGSHYFWQSHNLQ